MSSDIKKKLEDEIAALEKELREELPKALKTAAALGDLGARFPDTDERWKGADSMKLLAQCVEEVRSAGYTIGNIDATIVVQRPKLAPYIERMRESVARSVDVVVAQVSVKAKTSEGMGYTGDGSGIAVYAVVLIERS